MGDSYGKKYYYSRKAKGLCTQCGKPVEDGKATCIECRKKKSERRQKNADKTNKYRRDYTAKKKAEGLCIYCGTNKAREGKVSCQECADKQNAKKRETYKRMQEMGLCECGAKLIGQEKTCPMCKAKKANATARWLDKMTEEEKIKHKQEMRETSKARRDRWREEHRCITCGRKISDEDTHKTCPLCREIARNKAHLRYKPKRKEIGTCAFCNNPVYKDSRVCEKHYKIACERAEHARQFNHTWRAANDMLFAKKKVEE